MRGMVLHSHARVFALRLHRAAPRPLLQRAVVVPSQCGFHPAYRRHGTVAGHAVCPELAVPSSASTATVARGASEPTSLSMLPNVFDLSAGLSPEDAELLHSLQTAVESLGDAATADHPIVEAYNKVAVAYRDKAALLKRNWTDEMFQEGEGMNEERVAEIEAELAVCLGKTERGLEDGGNLGGALDLVGAYMKNYKLDKADMVLARCAPYVSQRGGVWMVKWLNHMSTVRMKQGRHAEALDMLHELELYSPYSAEEAPEFFETLYRNLAWALKALGRIDDAAVYFERMVQMSRSHKGTMDWFDCWDIGKLAATLAFRDGDMDSFYRGRALIGEALRMHETAEPEDLVMRAKVEDSLAECYLVVKDYDGAAKHYAAAYNLLLQTVGPNSPLFGKQARHYANLLLVQDKHFEALPYLSQAFAVESSKDAVKVHEVMELVDLMVNTNQRCAPHELDEAPSNQPALKALRKNLERRGLNESVSYGILSHKMSLLYLHEGQRSDKAVKRALRLAKESVRVLRAQQGNPEVEDWLRMSDLHLRMLASVRGSARTVAQ